jgi:hypothetical protein
MPTNQELINQYEYEKALLNSMPPPSPVGNSPVMFGNQNKLNLVEWELDFKPELENIERLLRNDILKRDKEGYEYWDINPDKERICFNELGVSDMVRNIIIIVNKNKALSYYKPEEINDRVRQIKHEIRVLIYNNYELYGMDNEYKMNNYSMLVLSIGSIIEDVYRRAMNGETHKGLADQRLVSQTEPLSHQPQYPININMGVNKKKWWNPFTWKG